MLYVCIPVHNEAPTIGVLLWRLRGAFQEFAREYELVVYDDGSTDATAEVLEPYTKVLPLTVLRGGQRRGLGAALDALARHVAAHTRYPRRDAMIVMEGDFTDRPEHIPELVKRFEGGADVVVTERRMAPTDPQPARRLRQAAPWILRPFVRVEGVADVTSTYRLIRISALRDLLRERGDAPIVSETGWAANAELLLALLPHARRVESLAVEPRYEVRPRPTRIRALADALALARFGWRRRGGARPTPARAAGAPLAPLAPLRAESALSDAGATLRESDAPALALTEAGAAESPRRRGRPQRDPSRPPRPTTEELAERAERRARREERAARKERPPREGRPERAERPERPERPARPERPREEAQETVDATAGEAESPAETTRRRRRSRRGARRDESTTPIDGSTAPDAATAPAEGTEVRPEGEADDATAGEGAAPTARTRRSRRSRKRRSAGAAGDAAGDATSETVGGGPDAGSAPGDEPSGSADGGEASGGDAAGGDGEGGAPRRRRSRRGRRRGRAPGDAPTQSTDGDDDGGDDVGAPAAAPGPDA